MGFKPFNFTFTPPLTVPAPPLVVTSGAGSSTSGTSSRAGALISKLDDLTVMSKYLQDAIVARNQKMAIEIDPTVDPNTTRALASIYGTDSPPNFITVPMYDQLLDAHIGALQLEMAVGTASTIQANPIQVGDLMTVISTIDAHLIASASYNNWLPLQLASLKADAVLFQSWKDSLKSYPAFYVTQLPNTTPPPESSIQAANLDIDSDLAEYEDQSLDHIGQSYSTVYQSMSSVHTVEANIGSVMGEMFFQPLGNVLRIATLLGSLKSLAHKPAMDTIQGDMVNYSFARLASDTTSMVHTSDQLVSLAVSPLSQNLGSLGRIVSGAQAQAAQSGYITSGPTTGLSKANACAQGNPYNGIPSGSPKTGTPLTIPGLGAVSDGLKYLAEKLNWAMASTSNHNFLINKSFRQLVERRLKQQDSRNEIMCSMRALDALVGLATGVASELQKGTVTANSSPQQTQAAASRILTSLQTSTNTTFVATGDVIVANPPSMPPAPPEVVNVLSRAKIRSTLGPIQRL